MLEFPEGESNSRKSETTDSASARETLGRLSAEAFDLPSARALRVVHQDGSQFSFEFDGSGKLQRLTMNSDRVMTRQGTSDIWTYTDKTGSGTWAGKIEVSKDGGFYFAPADSKIVQTFARSSARERENADGSVVEFNDEGKVARIRRANGSSVDCQYRDGKLVKVAEHKGAETSVWEKDNNANRWRSMSAVGSQRIRLSVSENGEMRWETVMGTKVTVTGEGSTNRLALDGSAVDLDRDGRVAAMVTADGNRLTLNYRGNLLTTITETTDAKQTVWERQDSNEGHKGISPDADNHGKSSHGIIWHKQRSAGDSAASESEETRTGFEIHDSGSYSYVTHKEGLVTEVRYHDGSRRFFAYKDRSIEAVQQTSAAGTTTWRAQAGSDRWTDGKREEERKDVRVDSTGTYSFVDASSFRHIRKQDGSESLRLARDVTRSDVVQEQRSRLDRLFESQTEDRKGRQRFARDLDTFERRAAARGLSSGQIAGTYQELNRLLSPEKDAPALGAADRFKLAQQIARHLAVPRNIDQGGHSTCNVATVQVIAAARHPEKFAAIVTGAAVDGQVRTGGGKIIKLDAQSLTPDWESRQYKPYENPPVSDRSFASQLFQVAAVNSYYAYHRPARRYEQHPPESPKDTGERLVNARTGKVVKKEFDGLGINEILAVGKQLLGEDLPVLSHRGMDPGKGMSFASQAELEQKLRELKKQNKLPAILSVHTANSPFFEETGSGKSGEPEGAHVVTVWDIDPAARVLLDNQWGRGQDYEGFRRLSIERLYKATRPR